jgi:hypothetical protein
MQGRAAFFGGFAFSGLAPAIWQSSRNADVCIRYGQPTRAGPRSNRPSPSPADAARRPLRRFGICFLGLSVRQRANLGQDFGGRFRTPPSGSPKTRFCELFSQSFLIFLGTRDGFELVVDQRGVWEAKGSFKLSSTPNPRQYFVGSNSWTEGRDPAKKGDLRKTLRLAPKAGSRCRR